MFGLDLEDEGDTALGTIISIICLYCYFVNYLEQINIWLIANGEDPLEFSFFSGSRSQQLDSMRSQMNDLIGEQMDRGTLPLQPDFSKLSNFAPGLDTGNTRSYNEDNGPMRGGANGPDIGELNPIRYRGYYYDDETGYYFCQTRYYNPQWRRWINADALFIAGDALTGSNMYAYCDGNPVMLVDPSGMDAYYFYISEYKGEAEKDKQVIMKYYKLSASQVHLIEVDNYDDFKKGWNSMPNQTIQVVVLNMHGTPSTLGTLTNQYLTTSRIEGLNGNIYVQRMVILGCNSGHTGSWETNDSLHCFFSA